MNINCIIVEDEPKAMYLVEEYVNSTGFLTLKGTFCSALDALNYLNGSHDVELLFLDINLPGLTGMELASVLNKSVKIIFTTAHSDFAVKSYEVNTVDYLLKPITYPRFLQAALKARNVVTNERRSDVYKNDDAHIFLRTGRKIIQINWKDILYVEGMKEYLAVVTAAQKILIYKRMADFEKIQPKNFQRIHNSFIVNLDHIAKVEDNIVLLNNREIPIGKTYKDRFFADIKNRLL